MENNKKVPKWHLKKVAISVVEVTFDDENGKFACLITIPKDYIPTVFDPIAFNLYIGENGLIKMIEYLKETYPDEYKHWRVPDEDEF